MNTTKNTDTTVELVPAENAALGQRCYKPDMSVSLGARQEGELA